jgi:FkbM family methyltransferase
MSRNFKNGWGIRQRAKYFLGNDFAPTRGRLRYFGSVIHFPIEHELFKRVCAEGVYESSVLNTICHYLPDDGVLMDVGANIGLIAIPVLARKPGCRVISFEPSPNSLPFLKQTHDVCPSKDRWQIVEKALGERVGQVEFSVNSDKDGAFDGRASTGRKGEIQTITIEMTSLDRVWEQSGRPEVNVLKIDVEGFEAEVLAGAKACIQATRPAILLEWSVTNLSGLGRDPLRLCEIAADLDYEIFCMPSGIHVPNNTVLKYHIQYSEEFLLYPRPPVKPAT